MKPAPQPPEPAPPSRNPRAAAARTLAAVAAGASLDDALRMHAAALAPADASLQRALAYGVLRERSLLEALGAAMLQKPLRGEPELNALLCCGVFQLRSMRVPPHAAVGETVAAASALGKPWAKGFLNAVLRRYAREPQVIEQALPDDPAVRSSFPAWLLASIRRDWGERWPDVVAASNTQGPLILRVNRRQGARADVVRQLAAAGLHGDAVPLAPDAIVLREAVAVEQLPGFAEGRMSVQDAAAQLAAPLLDACAGQRVLDACAAPGGKTAHLLEIMNPLQLLAIDSDRARLARIGEGLQRLRLDCPGIELIAADAADPVRWHPPGSVPFDRILLDAPCSGTGVIRRHPDIKWLRRAADIPALARRQTALLLALWPLLAAGGRLLYATCSILREEGDGAIESFLAAQPTASVLPIDAAWGEPTRYGRRIAPGGAFDGFYFALLAR
jgi:16S rRNA (cytosine967-C5)-methyltransferase